MIAFVRHGVCRVSASFNNAFSLFAKYQSLPPRCNGARVDCAHRQIDARLIRMARSTETSEPQSVKSRRRLQERMETIKKKEKEREMSDSAAFDGIAEGAKCGGSTHRYRENESRGAMGGMRVKIRRIPEEATI